MRGNRAVKAAAGTPKPLVAETLRAAVRSCWPAPYRCVRMEFHILGPLEALDEGRSVALGGSKQRALLAVLLLHANETLSADRLIDDLWGERPPATAGKTLQVHVSRLRRALAAGNGSNGMVVTRERGYELQLDPERLDLYRFERLVADGRRALAEEGPERAVCKLEEALSLWRGRPLGELVCEPFAQREIARLDEFRVDALERLIEAKLELGRHDEVVGQLETLIGEHPYREPLRAQLMLALYRSDRQADALQAYQDARRKLVEELGIEPGERLRELERKILEQSPELAPPKPQGRGTRGAPRPPAASPRSASGTSRWLWLTLRGNQMPAPSELPGSHAGRRQSPSST
jgi:DNA-binding SARP family transcriptional activator